MTSDQLYIIEAGTLCTIHNIHIVQTVEKDDIHTENEYIIYYALVYEPDWDDFNSFKFRLEESEVTDQRLQ